MLMFWEISLVGKMKTKEEKEIALREKPNILQHE